MPSSCFGWYYWLLGLLLVVPDGNVSLLNWMPPLPPSPRSCSSHECRTGHGELALSYTKTFTQLVVKLGVPRSFLQYVGSKEKSHVVFILLNPNIKFSKKVNAFCRCQRENYHYRGCCICTQASSTKYKKKVKKGRMCTTIALRRWRWSSAEKLVDWIEAGLRPRVEKPRI